MLAPDNAGVLLVAHGTIDQLDQMPEFLTEIRQGRPPTESMIQEMKRRYEVIGGSPLLRTTKAQASALAHILDIPVLYGMRFGSSKLSAALLGAAALKLQRVIVLPMAPFSVRLYSNDTNRIHSQLKSEGQALNLELTRVRPWGAHEGLIAAQRENLMSYFGGNIPEDLCIVVTAHSLPIRAIQSGDDYAQQIEAFVKAFERGIERSVVLAYQSQGQDSNEWLGPKLNDTLIELAKRGTKRVCIVPVGFLCDHVETLYDLDHEARAQAKALGLSMFRVPALNDAPALIDVMAQLVKESLPLAQCIDQAATSV